jgi:hypothetical protein
MLLTITTTHQPANDLGYLLHKHPERFQSFDLSFGKAHVYYPEVAVRGGGGRGAALPRAAASLAEAATRLTGDDRGKAELVEV